MLNQIDANPLAEQAVFFYRGEIWTGGGHGGDVERVVSADGNALHFAE